MELQNFPPGFAFLNVLLEPPHIWVVATSPDDNGTVVLLMLSSRRPGADVTCVLRPGDYSEISHETVVVYRLAEAQTTDWIRKNIKNGFFKIKTPMPIEVLERVQRGALDSNRTPRRIKRMVRGSSTPHKTGD